MQDKDKIIIFIKMFVGFEGINVPEAIIGTQNNMSRYFDDSAKVLVMPVFNEANAGMEVLNPKYISDEEYKKTVEMVTSAYENVMKEMQEQIKKYGEECRSNDGECSCGGNCHCKDESTNEEQ